MSTDITFTSTCDLYDRHLEAARVPVVSWKSFGGRAKFHGQVVTVKCFEDNSRVKELVESPGNDRVLVVDGGGSMRCALMGDMLGESAVANNWAGVVIYGCIRDSAVLRMLDLGIVALGTIPRKSTRRGEGQVDVDVRIGDIVCQSGDLAFVDSDGVLFLGKNSNGNDG